MTSPKTPTPLGISALLRKAGFERSKTYTTGVKGWHDRTSGYVARSHGEGEVSVRYESGQFHETAGTRARATGLEAASADAIEAAGYAVERIPNAAFTRLIVRAKAEA